jgi:hypothetical protein
MRHPLSAKLALSSPTSYGRSVGIVLLRTQAKVFLFTLSAVGTEARHCQLLTEIVTSHPERY